MRELKTKVVVMFLVLGPLIATLYALVSLWGQLISWLDLGLLIVMYLLVGMGVTIGFHRYLAHGAFQTSNALKVVLLVLGTMSLQGSPITWASIHRRHHAYSDHEGDVHSPQLSKNIFLGLVHAQFGWLFGGERPNSQRWSRDLLENRCIVIVNRLSPLWMVLGLIIPLAIGGWSGLLWGGLVRLFLTHHVTWSVNSVCHLYGSRPFITKDHSTNNWLVGLLGLGEGGHNTHHASPRSARHGLYWWHFDLSWQVIRLLSRVHLVHDVYTLDPESLKLALAEKAGSIRVIINNRLQKVRGVASI